MREFSETLSHTDWTVYIRIQKDFRQQVKNLFASPVLKDRVNKTYVFTAYIAVRT